MAWKCQICGFENRDAQVRCQGGCGYQNIPKTVTLTSHKTGKSRTIRIETSFKRSLLKVLAGEDGIYASNPQFRIYVDHDKGAWLLENSREATNVTYYNGSPLSDQPVEIKSGGVISLAKNKMELSVELR